MTFFNINSKYFALLFLIVGWIFIAEAQSNVFNIKMGQITFFSSTPIENIQAKTQKVATAINLDNGDVIFKVKINSFEFTKKLMQEHFNENYMESDKFPLAEFKGKILNPQQIKGNATYNVDVSGKLLIHGVSKDYTIKATLVLNNNQLSTISNFDVKLVDHHIKVSSIVGKNISEVIQVKIAAQFDKVQSQ